MKPTTRITKMIYWSMVVLTFSAVVLRDSIIDGELRPLALGAVVLGWCRMSWYSDEGFDNKSQKKNLIITAVFAVLMMIATAMYPTIQ